MHPLIERAFAHAGAVLIGELDQTWEIGLQQPMKHKRFVNFFTAENQTWMYFKHDPALALPDGALPSEIAPKHWSKVLLEPDGLRFLELLEGSHDRVVASLTVQGREALARLQGVANAFPTFHRLAQEMGADGLYGDVASTPELWVEGRTFARFSWNALELYHPTEWTTVGADRLAEWKALLEEARRSCRASLSP